MRNHSAVLNKHIKPVLSVLLHDTFILQVAFTTQGFVIFNGLLIISVST